MANGKNYHGHRLRKGRVSLPNQVYLITAVTAGRNPVFTELSAGRAVVQELIEAEKRGRAETLAYVVMPDHLHWLMSLDAGKLLADVIGGVKRYSAVVINRLPGGSLSPVWQRGFHDHALRNEESVIDVARYIIANPLRAGLVKRIGDYPLWDAVWL